MIERPETPREKGDAGLDLTGFVKDPSLFAAVDSNTLPEGYDAELLCELWSITAHWGWKFEDAAGDVEDTGLEIHSALGSPLVRIGRGDQKEPHYSMRITVTGLPIYESPKIATLKNGILCFIDTTVTRDSAQKLIAVVKRLAMEKGYLDEKGTPKRLSIKEWPD